MNISIFAYLSVLSTFLVWEIGIYLFKWVYAYVTQDAFIDVSDYPKYLFVIEHLQRFIFITATLLFLYYIFYTGLQAIATT